MPIHTVSHEAAVRSLRARDALVADRHGMGAVVRVAEAGLTPEEDTGARRTDARVRTLRDKHIEEEKHD